MKKLKRHENREGELSSSTEGVQIQPLRLCDHCEVKPSAIHRQNHRHPQLTCSLSISHSYFTVASRKTTGGEERLVPGKNGHTGDQKPAGEDQQHPPAL